jgi:NAD(P)-dependent dehydrogenase (short-subunit alcohol dehydrogenase family)
MGRLDGKVAAVTGGASGIGEATVRRFVAEGASVAFCDRDGERGQRVAAELETAGAKINFTQADVGTEAACLAFVNGAAQKFGRLDILINNAGIRKYEKVEEASAASWNEILNVNLMSYVFCAKAAVPLMRRNQGGAIVNVASVRSVVAGAGNLQYDTTKAAVAGLTRALAADPRRRAFVSTPSALARSSRRSISAASQRPARQSSSTTPRLHKAPC